VKKPIPQEDLFAIVTKETEPKKLEAYNVYEHFGITRKLLANLHYPVLRKVFYGMHNFTVSEFYTYMNPAEILGFMAGISSKDTEYMFILFPQRKSPLEKQISTIVSEGYACSIHYKCSLNTIARQLQKEHINPFSLERNALKQRIAEQIPQSLKEQITHELFKPKKYSDAETRGSGIPSSFHDPNIDGKSKTLYVNSIAKHFKDSYDTLRALRIRK
jgi:hypothetical protein